MVPGMASFYAARRISAKSHSRKLTRYLRGLRQRHKVLCLVYPLALQRSPALISCNHCYRPGRADRRRPIDATDGHGHPVRVSTDVLEGLDAVVLSGETDMNDTMEVQALAYLMGYSEAAWWVEYFPNLYAAGLINGFVTELPPGARST